jgi:hypothetical protein
MVGKMQSMLTNQSLRSLGLTLLERFNNPGMINNRTLRAVVILDGPRSDGTHVNKETVRKVCQEWAVRQ